MIAVIRSGDADAHDGGGGGGGSGGDDEGGALQRKFRMETKDKLRQVVMCRITVAVLLRLPLMPLLLLLLMLQ